jgi:predicted phosphoadenosine phosphosulfate sulfurtransferase
MWVRAYSIGICCFFRKLAALKSKSKDWLSWKQDNVSEWSDMSPYDHNHDDPYQVKFNEMMMMSTLHENNTLSWIYIVLVQ